METKVLRYPGQGFTVTYDVKRCIHSERCVHGLPAVFNPQAKPWIAPGATPGGEVLATVSRCPTGALHVESAEESFAEAPDPVNSITLTSGGPLYLRGRIQLVTKSRELIMEDTRMALCRCGASSSKPLCDNTHQTSGFDDPGAPGAQDGADTPPGTGTLRVHAIHNGPLHIAGPMVIRDAFGDPIFSGEETWLCRCGNSSDKPFCDGTHKKIGFTS